MRSGANAGLLHTEVGSVGSRSLRGSQLALPPHSTAASLYANTAPASPLAPLGQSHSISLSALASPTPDCTTGDFAVSSTTAPANSSRSSCDGLSGQSDKISARWHVFSPQWPLLRSRHRPAGVGDQPAPGCKNNRLKRNSRSRARKSLSRELLSTSPSVWTRTVLIVAS